MEKRTKLIGAHLSDDEKQEVAELAWELHLSQSELLRLALKNYIRGNVRHHD